MMPEQMQSPPHDTARRRHLVLLFSDLSNSVRLAAALDAEDYADLLVSLRHACEAAIAKHGGTILQIQGDGMLACFGHPEAREDDVRRATEAALDLHDMVRNLRPAVALPDGIALRLHTGIHAGLVLLGEGDAISGRMRVFGNAGNVTARLSDHADSDEILASEDALGADKDFFQTDAGRSLLLQGIADPVRVFKILGRAKIGTRFEARTKRGLTPFVGRRDELQVLQQRLHETMAGKPHYLAISAPAGQGKTRLAEEFLACAASFNVQIHRGYCESYLSAEPAQPFLQMLRSLCGLQYGMPPAEAAEAFDRTLLRTNSALAEDRSILLRALSLAGSSKGISVEQQAPEATANVIARLFDTLAAASPAVVFVDDWQWADDASRLVLSALRKLIRPILILVATRDTAPSNVRMSPADIISLNPFSADEAEEAIGRLLPGTNKFVVSEIRGYAGGNPLFVEELCHSAQHDRQPKPGDRGHVGMAWLGKLIEARVERLPTDQVELVRTAAVIGNIIPSRLLESVTGCTEDHPLTLALADQDLIYPGDQKGTLRFKHGIAREVIYESVGMRQRKALHLRIAEVLKQQVAPGVESELYEPLAYHYGAGGQAEGVVHYAELAADKAVAVSALDRAQVHYLAALRALDQLEASEANYQRWMQIAQRLALVCVFDPSREHLDVLLSAVERAKARGDLPALAYAEFWVGYVYFGLGDSREAIRSLDMAIENAGRVGDAGLIRQARATLGQACAAASDYERSIALLGEAIEAKRQRPSSGRPAVGYSFTLASNAASLGDMGRFDDAYQCIEEALESLHGISHEVEGSIQCWHSGIAIWHGQWARARAAAAKAQHVAERVKSLYLYAMSLALGGYANWMSQQQEGALQQIADATSWLQDGDRGLFISLNHSWLADGMAARGDWPMARRYAGRAIVRSRKLDRLGEGLAYRAMARAAVAGHTRKPFEHYLALSMRNARNRNSPHEAASTQLREAEIRLVLGQRAAAAPLLDQAAASFQAMAMTWHLEQVRRLQGNL